MGWIFVLLVVISFAFMTLCNRLATRKGGDPLGYSFFLFFGGMVFTFILMGFSGNLSIEKDALLTGVIGGLSGVIAMVAFSKALQLGHYGFSVSLLSASFVVMVLYSVVVWKEPVMVEGIVIILVSIFLIATSEKTEEKDTGRWGKWLFLMLLCFFANGITLISQGYASLLPPKGNLFYLFTTYITGVIFITFFVLRGKKEKFCRPNVLFGLLAAVVSILGTLGTLKACEYLPKTVVFPVYFSGFNIAGLLLSVFFFKDKVNLKGFIGIVLGILGVIIVSLKLTFF